MPRKSRVATMYGLFHIYSRGVEKRKIFTSEKDYRKFLDKLKKLTDEKNFSIYSFVLLPNHFHILLETNKIPISRIMSRLLTSYAVYFNKKYNRVGPLFQDRFKSILVQKDRYFLQLSRYIHLNPVIAGLVKDPKDYQYSCFREFLGLDSEYSLLDKTKIDRLIGETIKEKEEYIKFVYEGINKKIDLQALLSFNQDIFERDVLGTRKFNSEAMKRMRKKM